MVVSVLALIISAFAAIFTFWYVMETRKLRHQTIALGRQQIAEAKHASQAAAQSARAAEDTVKIATSALELEQRAYVFFSAVNLTLPRIPQPPERFEVEISITNAGKTPAINTKVRTHIRLLKEFSANLFESPAENEPAVIPPGLVVSQLLKTDEPLTIETFADLNHGNLKVFVWGVIEYEDIFGKRHSTKWCVTRSFRRADYFQAHSSFNTMD